MSVTAKRSDAPPYTHQVVDILGVTKSFRRNSQFGVAVHEALHEGLPRRALFRAIASANMPIVDLLPVFEISMRTYMRIKADPDKLLSTEQSGRVWRFSEQLEPHLCGEPRFR